MISARPAPGETGFEKEAAELVANIFGLNEEDANSHIVEALRAVAERTFEEGYWTAEQDKFKRLSPNPYTRPTQEKPDV